MFKYISGFVVGIALTVAVAGASIHWGPFFLTTDEMVQQIDAQTMYLVSNLEACTAAYNFLYKKGTL